MPMGQDAHAPGGVHAFAPICSQSPPSIRRAWAFTRPESVTIQAGQSFSVANHNRPRSPPRCKTWREMFRNRASCLNFAGVPMRKSGKTGAGLDAPGWHVVRAGRCAGVKCPPASSTNFRQASLRDSPLARWKKSTASPASPVAKSLNSVPSAFTLKLGRWSFRKGDGQEVFGSPGKLKCHHWRWMLKTCFGVRQC